MDIIDEVLLREEFRKSPPILIDIGASGGLHSKWKRIAKYSICIAFDADNREMGFTEKESDTFKKLIVFSRVVTDKSDSEIDFYLTKSPYCSSSLEPQNDTLKVWAFESLFEVEKKIKLKAIQLSDALKEANISGIDWFKSDTQGTDLRLFKSLPEDVRKNVLLVELEPGILDGYKGEDKLYDVIHYMHDHDYFMSTMEVKGTQRINPDIVSQLDGFHKTAWSRTLTKSPGWAELCYLNTLAAGTYDKRTYLLAYVFACLEKQFGFAIELANIGYQKTGDDYFVKLKGEALAKIKQNNLSWPRVMLKKAGQKILSYL